MYEGKIHVHANTVGSKLIQQTLILYSNSTNLADIHTSKGILEYAFCVV